MVQNVEFEQMSQFVIKSEHLAQTTEPLRDSMYPDKQTHAFKDPLARVLCLSIVTLLQVRHLFTPDP